MAVETSNDREAEDNIKIELWYPAGLGPDWWPPAVYRYMERRWANHFFETGELMLTTFARCMAVEGARRDPQEGTAVAMINHQHGALAFSRNAPNPRSYMLCSSLRDDDWLQEKFDGCDARFRIDDPARFAYEIAKALPGCENVVLGLCDYQPERGFTSSSPIDLMEGLNPGRLSDEEAAQFHETFMLRVAEMRRNSIRHEPHFIKPSEGYQDEEEFRFVWFVDHDVAAAPQSERFVVAPNARQYCSAAW